MADQTIRTLARAALQNLEANRQRIDDLNVYPVPDGDTGSNLVLTLRRVVETIEESLATNPAELADEVFHVALRAGKGNSGVIFSQILRGFAKSLGAADGVTAVALAEAFRAGSDAGYRAVSHVGAVEGTILTVIREMAEEAEQAATRRRARARARASAGERRGGARTDAGAPRRSRAGRCRRCRRRRARRDRARRDARGERRSDPDRSRPVDRARDRRRPPGALALPVLHGVRRRGRPPRCGLARGGARAARRLAPRRRRRVGAQGARAHRRPRGRTLRGDRDRRARRGRDRGHVRADRGPRGAPRPRPRESRPSSRPGSSRSSRERATVRSSRPRTRRWSRRARRTTRASGRSPTRSRRHPPRA